MNTHARLDELLHERNMTLYQLCQSGNIPYTTLRVSRCRGSQLSVDTIEQICKVLGISMAEFFTPSNQVRTH
ncbi:MAG: helix-turn-helix domain-containing protein [Oscillospiraceae bacterium]